MNNSPIRILLVDDHTILRDGLAALLKSQPGIEVVGGLSSGEEAVNEFKRFNPHIIIMDIVMNGMNGLEATRWIKETNPAIKVIIVSSEIKKELVSTGIKCGIDGYLPKDVSQDALLEAIHSVMQNKKYFNAAVMNLVFEDFYEVEKSGRKKNVRVVEELTAREQEVMRLIAEGKSNQEVADHLFISIKTVETHKGNIMGKLGFKNITDLVKYAIKNGIISLE